MPSPRDEALRLCHAIGNPEHDLCILGEGNVSARDDDTLWIKASGRCLATLQSEELVQVELNRVLSGWDGPLDEGACRDKLDAARSDPAATGIPSTETFMHAALLELPNVQFVAHTHPTPLLAILSLADADEWAARRLFPDEIVCCGPQACFVPYVAPGLELAKSVRRAVEKFNDRVGLFPKTIWLQNHGLIALGSTASEVLAASLMSVKAARILLGALQTGREIRWLTKSQVDAIQNWPDEHYRQKIINASV